MIYFIHYIFRQIERFTFYSMIQNFQFKTKPSNIKKTFWGLSTQP
jgi:hypothetical protein